MRSFWIITGLGFALIVRAVAQDGIDAPSIPSVTATPQGLGTPATDPAVDPAAAPANADPAMAASKAPVEITADGETTYVGGLATASGNVVVRHGPDLLYADRVTYDMPRKLATADGNVRIYSGTRVYRGEHVTFNFETKAFASNNFSLAAFPIFAKGEQVTTPEAGHYHLRNAYITTDNRAHPSYRIKAHTIEIYPDDRVVMKDVVVLVGDVPVFYLPYYSQSLKSDESTFLFRGGDSSEFGATGQLTVNWRVSDDLAAAFHEDYRSKRGEAGGLDLKYRPVPDGTGFFRGYWADDKGYTYNPTDLPRAPIDKERYLFTLQQITPLGDGLEAKLNFNVWSDPYITEDFFQKMYGEQRMPDNTVEVLSRFPDFEVSVLGRPQLDRFFDATERAPEVRLESKPIKIGGTGIEYQTENSIVNFQRVYGDQLYAFNPAPTPNGLPKDYSAYRWDTYHQFLYPKEYFDFLSVTPHVGFRGTAWSNDNENLYTSGQDQSLERATIDAGADFSFKISRTWTDAKNGTLAVDGIRHVFEPFVTAEAILPSAGRNDLLGFDTRLPNTWANPIGFPSYNSIDSIDRQFVVREGVRNTIQTKRDGQNWNLIDWSVFTDVNLTGYYNEEQVFTHDTFSHVYSEATLKPFTWIRFTSRAAVDIDGNSYNMLDHSITWQPERSFEFSLGDRLLRDVAPTLVDPYGYAIPDSNLVYIRTFYRMNEHWQFETIHQFDTDDSQLQEQTYSVYRDLSAWQLGVSVGQRNNRDAKSEEMIYFTLTLKAFPVAALRATE